MNPGGAGRSEIRTGTGQKEARKKETKEGRCVVLYIFLLLVFNERVQSIVYTVNFFLLEGKRLGGLEELLLETEEGVGGDVG